ncbi:hypothetical protein EZV73_06275 [Acidaminobacter sp. JC074]|uniref:GH116 family glycosyl-hydrolase n=1 Tax=Acidaminobacter sp. JC074 TaxID=2530199 RepID=UPI001F1184C4|nr:GH116 family glycosyl-hydrolase [Acidaminobacter sp. JC074]MCH4887167.1 hypothetical protein [Acidaminobacter sp. JC074]
MIYRGQYTSEISFPLGGIGSGSIGLAGNGALIDWEINNRPNRETINSFTNFAIKAENDYELVDFRLLQGDISKDFMGGMHKGNHSWGYGHGPNRGTMSGMKHFSDHEFKGEFPIAELSFKDEKFPGAVTLEAFNPFIPSNDLDSSIPTAMFHIRVNNTSDQTLKYTVALSVTNPLKSAGKNHYFNEDGLHGITMNSRFNMKSHLQYGNVTIASDCEDTSYQEYWYRGGWFDNVTMFINDFSRFGPLKNRRFDKTRKLKKDTATLAGAVSVKPGESKIIKFNIAWYVPNYWKYWLGTVPTKIPKWKNYYAKLFDSSKQVSEYCFKEWDRLYSETKMFKDTLFESDLPEPVLDAIQGNLATLKSTTCLRLTDGEFYGWEGVNKTWGSCEGTCQHVWNYAYALPFLFPKLERSIRDLEMKYNLSKSGKMNFRLMLPLGNAKQPFRACVDGQLGTVMKFYREWKISGNTKWLKRHWPNIKKCLEFTWSEKNPDKWDIDKTGVLHGRQHHTLDVELYGPHAWLTGFYHGALLAGAEMARAVGELDKARDYENLYQKGHEWIENNTFNGEYYIQDIDVKSKAVLDKYGGNRSLNMSGGYWDEETGEIKYQIGNGVEIDQVVADWHADLMGLSSIFNQDHRRKALESIYKYNFISLRDINNPCRVFGVNGESGLLMCNWKDINDKPKITIPYTEEVMSGFEYAAACNMLQCGMENEALEIVKSIRDRYDGMKRNPFAEIECGASYARAMASYSFLLTYSGFKYDMTKRMIGFKPLKDGKYFWSIDGAWGSVLVTPKGMDLKVLYGKLELEKISQPFKSVKTVHLNREFREVTVIDDVIEVSVQMKSGDLLTIEV